MFDMGISNKLKVLIAEKEIRENRRLSFRIVAEEAKIPLSVLTAYVYQKVKRFDKTTLEKLCQYFGVQPGDLLVYSDNEPAPRPKTKTKTRS